MTEAPSSQIPTILIDFKKSRIRIHKQTLRLMGYPEYLRLLVNPGNGVIALQVCEGSDVRSHHNDTKKQSFELYSRSFLQQLLLCGRWSSSERYRLDGRLLSHEGTAFFRMENAVTVSLHSDSEQRKRSNGYNGTKSI